MRTLCHPLPNTGGTKDHDAMPYVDVGMSNFVQLFRFNIDQIMRHSSTNWHCEHGYLNLDNAIQIGLRAKRLSIVKLGRML